MPLFLRKQQAQNVNHNSISINGEKVKDLDYVVSKEQAIGGKFTVIRRGKKKYFLIKHV